MTRRSPRARRSRLLPRRCRADSPSARRTTRRADTGSRGYSGATRHALPSRPPHREPRRADGVQAHARGHREGAVRRLPAGGLRDQGARPRQRTRRPGRRGGHRPRRRLLRRRHDQRGRERPRGHRDRARRHPRRRHQHPGARARPADRSRRGDGRPHHQGARRRGVPAATSAARTAGTSPSTAAPVSTPPRCNAWTRSSPRRRRSSIGPRSAPWRGSCWSVTPAARRISR